MEGRSQRGSPTIVSLAHLCLKQCAASQAVQSPEKWQGPSLLAARGSASRAPCRPAHQTTQQAGRTRHRKTERTRHGGVWLAALCMAFILSMECAHHAVFPAIGHQLHKRTGICVHVRS